MNKNHRIYTLAAFISALISISLHVYLAAQHYKLKFGEGVGKSLCDINATFSCAAVSASEFSTIFGIPIAVLGAWTNFILAMILFVALLLGSEGESWRRYGFWLSALSAIASLVMGSISATSMTVYCPFCIVLYVLSLEIAIVLALSLSGNPLKYLHQDAVEFIKGQRGMWIMLALIPVGSWVVNYGAYKKVGGVRNMELAISEQILIWESSPKYDFDTSTAITLGRADAPIQIVEFADFRCGHCRDAAPRLELFAKSHPDVAVHLLFFPLDGDCNESFERSSGISCRLSKIAYCVTKQDSQKGHQLKNWVFEEQARFSTLTSVDDNMELYFNEIGMDWPQSKACAEEKSTHEVISAQAKQGAKAQIQGTPTVFMNGRMLPGGQLLPVLEAAYQHVKKSK